LKIRLAQANDEAALIQLITEFRLSLATLRGKVQKLDFAAARKELDEYLEKEFPIYLADSETATIIGYSVCRVEGDVVWVESLYVVPKYRRKGVGSSLYEEAERLAQEHGGNTPYNWVDPNNDTIIRFLQKRGYSVLNLIELRRAQPGEEMTQKLCVGTHEFDFG